MELDRKIALVTGASRGIGAAIAIDLARHGAIVVVNYLSSHGAAKDVVRQIKADGGEAVLAQRYDRRVLINRVIRKFGQIDILVNNAAIFMRQAVWRLTESVVLRQLMCNYVGALFLTKSVAEKMRHSGGGTIINIASNAGLRPNNHLGIAYGASKAALIHSSLQLVKSLHRHNIRVNVVAPGHTDTDMGGFAGNEQKRIAVSKKEASGRINSPEDVAQVVTSLVSGDRADMNGKIVEIRGGLCLT